jgi:transcriptional regulator with GAF, ATPase, and Fis domain
LTRATDPGGVAAALATMARDLLAQPTVEETVERIVAHAVDLVDGCEAAGVLVVRDGVVHTLAATHALARESDRAQGELGEGPCLNATLDEEQVFRIADMAAAGDRWPRYAPAACELGIGSAMGFLLFTDEENLGALNLYASRSHAFGTRTEHVGWLLAAHASVAFASSRTDAQLREAIGTRQDVGEAVGIIMERHKLTEEQAYELLRSQSRARKVKLRVLARAVLAEGGLGGRPMSSPPAGSQ